MLKLFATDRITHCEPPQPEEPALCLFCSATLFRVAVVLHEDESVTRMLLCREHYAAARLADAEFNKLDAEEPGGGSPGRVPSMFTESGVAEVFKGVKSLRERCERSRARCKIAMSTQHVQELWSRSAELKKRFGELREECLKYTSAAFVRPAAILSPATKSSASRRQAKG